VRRELVEYKYVVLNADGTVDRWQPGDNLTMEVPVAQVRDSRQLSTAITAATATAVCGATVAVERLNTALD
jgi:hypothetical protein